MVGVLLRCLDGCPWGSSSLNPPFVTDGRLDLGGGSMGWWSLAWIIEVALDLLEADLVGGASSYAGGGTRRPRHNGKTFSSLGYRRLAIVIGGFERW